MKIQIVVRVGEIVFTGVVKEASDDEIDVLYARLESTSGRRKVLNPFEIIHKEKVVCSYFGDTVVDNAIITVIEHEDKSE